jgi:Na+/citrate or Na+/malate symporter
MDPNAMRLFTAVFFISLPIWVILTIVTIFSPSSGSVKADYLFAILTFGGLLGMVGGNIVERFKALKERGSNDPIP